MIPLIFIAAIHVQQLSASSKNVPGSVDIITKQGLVRFVVEGDTAIRIMAGPNLMLKEDPDLSLIHHSPFTNFKVMRSSKEVILKTSKIEAIFNRQTSSIIFQSLVGKVLLMEEAFPRSFAPATVGSTHEFSASQKFKIDPSEEFYGLGGHQRDGLGYRGSTTQLEQVNTETAIPFLLSSKGYGILSNEMCGQTVTIDADSTPPNPKFLIDSNGKVGGLTGTYFDGQNFNTKVKTRRDEGVHFNWNRAPLTGLKQYNFSVRWLGSFYAPRTGTYRFQTTADDGARLWIDGKQVIDDWHVQAAHRSTASLYFVKGSKHSIRLDYFQAGGGAEIDFGWQLPPTQHEIDWKSDFLNKIDYTFLYGPSFDKLEQQYRYLTGQAPMFGKWAYGYWQCKEHYNTQGELLSVTKRFRDDHIPLDNIVQDWFYWDPAPWGSHQFDPVRYPDMTSAMAQLHLMHTHLMISVWGKFQAGSSNYNALKEAGYLYPGLSNSNDPATIRYYDAFNPAARKLYWKQIASELYSKGIDAWWLDASEPEIPTDVFAKFNTFEGPAAKVLLGYPLMHTEGVYKGQRLTNPGKRVFILTRSATSGQQRNAAAVWSGDIQGTWPVFKQQVSDGLNFCMSGIPYWTTDIGGFFSKPASDPAYQELFARWFEWGSFCPIFRVHGTGAKKEPWEFGPKIEPILLKYDRLRYRLLPYIYSEAWGVTHRGGTIMRALPMDFPNDVHVRNTADEFMFGPDFLVAPVTEQGAVNRKVYLPEQSNWFDFWTGKPISKGQTNVRAPLGVLPLFVRGGSILPIGPSLEYSTQKAWDPLEIRIFPGKNGAYQLYNDAGEGYGYEHGEYSTIDFQWDDRSRSLIISAEKGHYPGMLNVHHFNVRLVNGTFKTVTYLGKKMTIRL